MKPTGVGAVGAHDSQVMRRFEREAQVTASLKSPHTIDLFDFGRTDDGVFYYVMELLDGMDLDKLVQQYGPQPLSRVAFLLEQACHSLHEAHAAALVHRDIKPANLIMCRYGVDFDFLKVLDFGLVALHPKGQTDNMRLTVNGAVPGTAAYMAPEMVTDGEAIGAQTDLYSLGCVAYWLLTGHHVFAEKTAMATLVAHVKNTPDPPSAVTEMLIPAEMDHLVMACLEKDPARRPVNARELGERLRDLAAANPWTQEQARSWWETHRPDAPLETTPC